VLRNLYVVFSKPPAGLSWEDYDRWYFDHGRENIESPGFKSVQRYRVDPVVVGSGVGPSRAAVDPAMLPVPYNHMAIFEVEGDIADVRADLSRRVAGGDIVLPEWFNDVPFATWSAKPIDERAEPTTHP
jgi:hypothetical protein